MRLYVGHRLPLGFYGGISFGTHHNPPRSVVHRDGSATELHPIPHGMVYFTVLIAGIAFLAWVLR
jgi:hypothetical protein